MIKKHTISIAPMMAYTDRHFRYLMRLISQHTVLYTEMVTAQAIIYGDKSHLLDFSDAEQPVVLQLGGSDPSLLAQATKIAEAWGCDEVNINIGCPSPRVQKGCFGAALMKEPQLVAECFEQMQSAVNIPVTIKTRLGVDECDSDVFLHEFVGRQVAAGCRLFVMHARKAWLSGLSPKENRNVPPLQYDRVYALKKAFPEVEVIINGGVNDFDSAAAHCEFVDGVMFGRQAVATPFMFSQADSRFYGKAPTDSSRLDVLSKYLPYVLAQYAKGVPMRHLTRHLIPLFQGQPGAKSWRRRLSEASHDDQQLVRAIESVL